jgi:hypothetical protein
MNEIRKVINWAQQPPATASAANTPTRQRQHLQPFSPSAAAAGEMSLAAEENFVDDGYGAALFNAAAASNRSRGASAAGAGLPGPQSDGLPLMLEDVQLSIPASQLAAAARKRSSDGAGSSRGSVGDGDGMVSVTAGSGGSRAGGRHSSSKASRQWAPPEVDVSVSASGLQDAQEGSCYQDAQQLYSDGSRADIGSDCSRWVQMCSCNKELGFQLS